MQMIGFAMATMAPVALIAAGAWQGGVWAIAALLYMTAFTAGMDRFVPRLFPDTAEGAEFPAGKSLSVALGLVHFALLVGVVGAAAQSEVGLAATLFTLIAAALWLGQVSHPNAHELIHRPERGARMLGRAVYGSVLMGHHASAHLLVHHVHVGTVDDPNSAPRGMGFYRFFLSAWGRSYRAALRAETTRRARARAQGKRRLSLHPFAGDMAVAALGLGASMFGLGVKGLAAYLFLCLYAQAQILLADYVQHYGLRRAMRDTGRPEPVGDAHSWNSPHWFSSALMVNAPRHSDHHLHPTRPYPGLRLREGMPILPHSLPVMAVIALVPPLWRRVMARELARLPGAGKSA